MEDKRLFGTVEEGQCLRVVGFHGNGFRPGVGVNGIAGDGIFLGHNNRSHHAVDADFAVFVREILPRAGDLPVFIGHGCSVRVVNAELDAGEGLARLTVLLDNHKTACLAVPEYHFQHIPGGNRAGLGRSVQHITGDSFRLPHVHGHTRLEILHPDFAGGIRSRFQPPRRVRL